jgi:hypothetical protein
MILGGAGQTWTMLMSHMRFEPIARAPCEYCEGVDGGN